MTTKLTKNRTKVKKSNYSLFYLSNLYLLYSFSFFNNLPKFDFTETQEKIVYLSFSMKIG